MPTTLINLPTEVLYLIVSNFRLLRPRKPKPHPQNQKRQTRGSAPSDRQSLVSLIATCRHLRNVIQTLLYKAVYPYTAEIEFARTLRDRPDLAAQVRELYYASNAHEDRQNRPLYLEPVNRHALKQSKPSGKSNFNELAATHPQGLDVGDLYEDENGEIRGQDCLGLWGHLRADSSNACDIKRRILERNLLIQTLQLVPKLQKLSLWYESYDIKQLPPGILPCIRECQIFGRESPWSAGHATIKGFSEAMPTLQILNCNYTVGLVTEKSSTITDLNLNYCALERGEFDKIAAGFTSLRKLSYRVQLTEDQFPSTTARDVCKALHPRRDTLRDLTIWYDGHQPLVGPPSQTWEPLDHSPTLRALTGLERLSLNIYTLSDLRKSLPIHIPFGALFPRSVYHVELCLDRTSADDMRPYLAWVSGTRTKHPALRRIIICHHVRDPDLKISGLFRAKGAVYSCRRGLGHDEFRLKEAHMLNPLTSLWEYDEYPGWQFWDPKVEPMERKYRYG